MSRNRSYISPVTPSESDLLPPVPLGVSVRIPALMTARDLNFRSFFEPEGDIVIRLRPEIISLFPEMLPILEWVVKSVKKVLEIERGSGAHEKSVSERAVSIDHAVRILNESISPAVASVILKNRYTDKPHLLALFGDHAIPDDDQMRSIARRAITAVLQMGIVKSRRVLANECDINPGQLSNFVRANGALGMEKIIECLDYVAAKAEKAGRLEELKRMIFDD